jgi:hypothetical protein
MSGSTNAQAAPSPKGLANSSSTAAEKKATATKTPRAVKNQKEIAIEIAALKGKGYPAPVDLDTGMGQKKRGL